MRAIQPSAARASRLRRAVSRSRPQVRREPADVGLDLVGADRLAGGTGTGRPGRGAARARPVSVPHRPGVASARPCTARTIAASRSRRGPRSVASSPSWSGAAALRRSAWTARVHWRRNTAVGDAGPVAGPRGPGGSGAEGAGVLEARARRASAATSAYRQRAAAAPHSTRHNTADRSPVGVASSRRAARCRQRAASARAGTAARPPTATGRRTRRLRSVRRTVHVARRGGPSGRGPGRRSRSGRSGRTPSRRSREVPPSRCGAPGGRTHPEVGVDQRRDVEGGQPGLQQVGQRARPPRRPATRCRPSHTCRPPVGPDAHTRCGIPSSVEQASQAVGVRGGRLRARSWRPGRRTAGGSGRSASARCTAHGVHGSAPGDRVEQRVGVERLAVGVQRRGPHHPPGTDPRRQRPARRPSPRRDAGGASGAGAGSSAWSRSGGPVRAGSGSGAPPAAPGRPRAWRTVSNRAGWSTGTRRRRSGPAPTARPRRVTGRCPRRAAAVASSAAKATVRGRQAPRGHRRAAPRPAGSAAGHRHPPVADGGLDRRRHPRVRRLGDRVRGDPQLARAPHQGARPPGSARDATLPTACIPRRIVPNNADTSNRSAIRPGPTARPGPARRVSVITLPQLPRRVRTCSSVPDAVQPHRGRPRRRVPPRLVRRPQRVATRGRRRPGPRRPSWAAAAHTVAAVAVRISASPAATCNAVPVTRCRDVSTSIVARTQPVDRAVQRASPGPTAATSS